MEEDGGSKLVKNTRDLVEKALLKRLRPFSILLQWKDQIITEHFAYLDDSCFSQISDPA